MCAGGFHEEREEALDPPVDGAAIDGEATFGQPLNDVGIAQAVADIPPHSQRDHIIGEAVMRKGARRAGCEAPAAIIAPPPLAAQLGLPISPRPLTPALN